MVWLCVTQLSFYIIIYQFVAWDPLKAMLDILRSRLETKGDWAFPERAPTLLNNLLKELILENPLPPSKLSLKTYLYCMAFDILFVLVCA